MENRKIRHLYTKHFTGAFYVDTAKQTPENIQLLVDNTIGFRAISRLNEKIRSKYWHETNKGKDIITPKYLTK